MTACPFYYPINMRHLIIYTIAFSLFATGCNNNRRQETKTDNTRKNSIQINDTEGNDNVNKSLKLICNISWNIPEDGFSKITTDIVNAGIKSDGFVYVDGMKLKQDGITGMFDIENRLNGIHIDFSEFVIGEAPDYSQIEKRKIHDTMKKNNEKISSLISAITEIAGQYQVCGFDEDDTDLYFENGTNMLAEWITDTGRITLLYSNKSDGTGCRMRLMLERHKKIRNILSPPNT